MFNGVINHELAMAGTDHQKAQKDYFEIPIILIYPQLAVNIGAVARAMLNCGFYQLRLVLPGEDPLSQAAISMSAGAQKVLEKARIFETFEEAVADLNYVIGTTARPRKLSIPSRTLEETLDYISIDWNDSYKIGFVFGQERIGLQNIHLSYIHQILEIPLNEGYASLNLAQAVLLVCYGWRQKFYQMPRRKYSGDRRATQEEMGFFFKHLEEELMISGFLRLEEARPIVTQNIRSIFMKSHLTEKEVRMLHGIIRDLRYGNAKRMLSASEATDST